MTTEPALRGNRKATIAILLLVCCGTALSAHRRDEYLEAARIAVAPGGVDVSLDLTPGVAVADRVISDIDLDRDGAASAAEQQAYVRGVLRALSLDVDGVPLATRIHTLTFPSFESFRRGEGSIALQIGASLPPLVAGAHGVRFRNSHEPELSVYLANALVPETDRVAITGQRRDTAQRELTIYFELHAPSSRWRNTTGGFGLAILTALLAAATARRWRTGAPRVSAGAGTATTLPAPPRTQWSR
jgi:hypothetical protein